MGGRAPQGAAEVELAPVAGGAAAAGAAVADGAGEARGDALRLAQVGVVDEFAQVAAGQDLAAGGDEAAVAGGLGGVLAVVSVGRRSAGGLAGVAVPVVRPEAGDRGRARHWGDRVAGAAGVEPVGVEEVVEAAPVGGRSWRRGRAGRGGRCAGRPASMAVRAARACGGVGGAARQAVQAQVREEAGEALSGAGGAGGEAGGHVMPPCR